MTGFNYYFDDSNKYHPFVGSSVANPNSLPPDRALREKPDFKEGFHPCEKDGAWVQVPDYRGTTVYNITTAQGEEIKELGELPAEVTTIAPDVDFPKWNGKKWVTDKVVKKTADIAAAEAQKQHLLSEATTIIDPLQDAVDLDMATPEEEALLKAWKKYRVLLNRVDTSTASDIIWPEKPE